MLGVIQDDHSKCNIQFSDILCSVSFIPYYFKFKMHFFLHFCKLKVRACLKVKVLFFTF